MAYFAVNWCTDVLDREAKWYDKVNIFCGSFRPGCWVRHPCKTWFVPVGKYCITQFPKLKCLLAVHHTSSLRLPPTFLFFFLGLNVLRDGRLRLKTMIRKKVSLSIMSCIYTTFSSCIFPLHDSFLRFTVSQEGEYQSSLLWNMKYSTTQLQKWKKMKKKDIRFHSVQPSDLILFRRG